ncbi:MAG: flap endonuclease, partial [Ornithinimicrobium sp.]
MSPSQRLVLLDTASLYFRAFYGVKEPQPGPDGTPTNAIRGLVDMIATLVTRFEPT